MNMEKILTGYEKIDSFTGGFGKGELILIRSRYLKIGRQLVYNIVANVCRADRKVLLLSDYIRNLIIVGKLIQIDRFVDYRKNLSIDVSYRTTLEEFHDMICGDDADLIVIKEIRGVLGNYFSGLDRSLIGQFRSLAQEVGKTVILSLSGTEQFKKSEGEAGSDVEFEVRDDAADPFETMTRFRLYMKDRRNGAEQTADMMYYKETGTIYEADSRQMRLLENARQMGLDMEDCLAYVSYWKNKTDQIACGQQSVVFGEDDLVWWG